jgi:hypothetical protein
MEKPCVRMKVMKKYDCLGAAEPRISMTVNGR